MIESRLRCMDVYCKILSNLLYLRFFRFLKLRSMILFNWKNSRIFLCDRKFLLKSYKSIYKITRRKKTQNCNVFSIFKTKWDHKAHSILEWLFLLPSGKFLKRWEYQTTSPASWEICMQVKRPQLELDMQQQTDSNLGKEYIKAVYCHPADLTFMQSASCEMPGWMKRKLESRLPELSITSDMQMTPLWCQKAKN